MQDVLPFEYQGKPIRVLRDDRGEPWWVAVDVCRTLGVLNPSDAIKKLDEDEKTTLVLTEGLIDQGFSDNVPGTSLNLISEAGLYRMILTSRKPEAKAFQRWVTHEVLPSIRKTGQYVSPEKAAGSLARYRDADWEALAKLHASARKIVRGRQMSLPDQARFADRFVERMTGVPLASIVEDILNDMGYDPTKPSARKKALPKKSASDDAGDRKPEELLLLGETQSVRTKVSPEAELLPTDLGELLGGYTAIAFNRLLYGLGYQQPCRVPGKGSVWQPTEKGKPFAVKKFVPRANSRGADVPQLLWKASILDALRKESDLQMQIDRVSH